MTLVGSRALARPTAQELATDAGLRGAQVLWDRCNEEQGMPSYRPLVRIGGPARGFTHKVLGSEIVPNMISERPSEETHRRGPTSIVVGRCFHRGDGNDMPVAQDHCLVVGSVSNQGNRD